MLHDAVAYFNKTPGLIRTAEMGRDLAQVLGTKAAVLMKNHGVTCCGPTAAVCTLVAIFLERACTAQLLAASSGLPWSGPLMEDLADGENARVTLAPPIVEDLWQYFQRQLDRHEVGHFGAEHRQMSFTNIS